MQAFPQPGEVKWHHITVFGVSVGLDVLSKLYDAPDLPEPEREMGALAESVGERAIAGHFVQAMRARPLRDGIDQGSSDSVSLVLRFHVPALDVRHGRAQAAVGVAAKPRFQESAESRSVGLFRDERDTPLFPSLQIRVDLASVIGARLGPECLTQAQPFAAIRGAGSSYARHFHRTRAL